MSEIDNDKEKLGAIKNDSEKEDLRINLEEEEEEGGDTGYEDGQGECKDYSSTLAHDLLDDRFYLDDDDSTDKFNSRTIKGFTDLFHIYVTLTSLFHQIKLSNHLLKLKIDDMLNQSSKDTVFDAASPHTLRTVDIPYINVKKSGPHNSRNH
ncbi:hypothetical protein V1477_001506 [Vespula maculifrons]|uniref:Uncharacterized protein n=1 Tax=Vespula maculifrons TaxID=7453 RepID=A0ABD2CYQ7_VESMC